MLELGIIGFGNFGQFAAPYLTPYCKVTVYDKFIDEEILERLNVKSGTLKEVASRQILLLAVPVQFLEEVLIEIKDIVNPDALVLDVSSVKVKPLKLMVQYLPETVEIIGLHPLFGPQSGKNGVEGLNMVVCPVRTTHSIELIKFFDRILKLNVLERTPEIHDKQMAYVQALTHFIGRAVNEMDIPDVEQKTPAYQFLLNIKRNLGQDSLDLFYTIEKENPFAKGVRTQFLRELNKLNKMCNN
ncbi:MAG TPA: prephenate dehydrogenase/arogenate dehydrogenase family protein [Cytophagales bacterium]|nr:prephenate dehydrogenase/arogenate dehydrogenase family protein [Cytophagales bacterium]